VKKSAKSREGASGQVGFSDQEWDARWPVICEHLGHDFWDDGSPRELSTLTVSSDGGLCKVALNDLAGRRSAYATAGSFVGAMDSLEAALAEERVSWRAWHKSGGKGRG